MNTRELPVGVVEIKFDFARSLRAPASDLGKAKLKTVGNIDTHPVFRASDGVSNGLAGRFYESRHHEPSSPGIDVNLELNRLGERFQFGGAHSRVHPPRRRRLGGVLPSHDPQERVALLGRCTLVDNQLHPSVAFVHRPGPRPEAGRAKPVEFYIGVPTFVDLQTADRFAVAVRR